MIIEYTKQPDGTLDIVADGHPMTAEYLEGVGWTVSRSFRTAGAELTASHQLCAPAPPSALVAKWLHEYITPEGTLRGDMQ